MIIGWKPAEIETLKRMRQEGSTVNEVAIALGRPYRSVVDKTRYLRENEGFRPPRNYRNPAAHHQARDAGSVTARKCLGCGEQFPSEHKFNRICFRCSQTEVFR